MQYKISIRALKCVPQVVSAKICWKSLCNILNCKANKILLELVDSFCSNFHDCSIRQVFVLLGIST